MIRPLFPWFFLACLASPLAAQDAAAVSEKCAALATTALKAGHRGVLGQDGWIFLSTELAHLGKGPVTAQSAAPAIKVITAFHKALAAENVTLVVLPVSAKAEIYPDKLIAGCPREALKGRMDAFFEALNSAGVTVVNLAAALREKGGDEAYCLRDSHWSPSAAALAADRVATELKSLVSSGGSEKLVLGMPEKLSISGDLLDEAHLKSLGPETVTLTYAGRAHADKIEPVAPVEDAPVIVLGDSHTLVFSEGASSGFHSRGAGLVDHLQQRLGQSVMQISSPASGADNARMQLARKAFANPEFWSGKKAVIWCFAVRELTESKWREIPMKK